LAGEVQSAIGGVAFSRGVRRVDGYVTRDEFFAA
jgi:hypothetical protein